MPRTDAWRREICRELEDWVMKYNPEKYTIRKMRKTINGKKNGKKPVVTRVEIRHTAR